MEKEFKVSQEIYDFTFIQEAIREFSQVVEIVFKNGILTVAGDSEDEIQEVFNEFMNYVLSL